MFIHTPKFPVLIQTRGVMGKIMKNSHQFPMSMHCDPRTIFLKISLENLLITKYLTVCVYISSSLFKIMMRFYLLFLTQFQWKYVNNIYACMPRYLRICRQPHFALTSEIICIAGDVNYCLRMIKANLCFPSSVVSAEVFELKNASCWRLYFCLNSSISPDSLNIRQQT